MWINLFLSVSESQSFTTLCKLMDCSPPGSSVHGDSPPKNTGVGCHALLQGIFSTQGSDPGLSHCKQILYQLSHQGSPRILEWVACPFSRGSSRPRDQTQVSHIASRFFTSWATSEAQEHWSGKPIPSPQDLPSPEIKLRSSTLQADSLPAEPQEKPKNTGVGSLYLLQRICPTQESNRSPALQVDSLPTELSGKPFYS